IGEAIARLLSWQGAKVKRACYQGDVGLHVAKAIWAARLLPQPPEDIRGWGEAYARGSQAYDTDPAARIAIETLNKVIFERRDEAINALYDQGKKVSLAHFEEIYHRLGTAFDYYFLESVVAPLGQELVERWREKGVFEIGTDGAIIFRGEKDGLHTRVFINALGLPTYEAKDLGLNTEKFTLEPELDQSLIVTANEQNAYFAVVLKVLNLIAPAVGAKTKHLSHGLLRLATGKMSSRAGNVITGEGLIEEVATLVKAKMVGRDLAEKIRSETVERVALGAIKYWILKQAPGQDIIFDPDHALSLAGDSGPYLQYTLVRARAVLKKAASRGLTATFVNASTDAVIILERWLGRFPETGARAAAP
ncbi:MAG: arginine--tRNA ligase, partial [Patescibacteria group bacterium]